MPDLDYRNAKKANRLAVNHARKGTHIEKAWPEIVAVARPAIGGKMAKIALGLPITPSLVEVASVYTALLVRDQPDAKVKGLWFGLVELDLPETSSAEAEVGTVITPYLSDARRFDPNDSQWPCDPIWMAKDCYAFNNAMSTLTDLRNKIDDESMFNIDQCLIEPLNTLFAGQIARHVNPAVLLGKAKQRGIGCGFDSGEFRTLGVVTQDGFKQV